MDNFKKPERKKLKRNSGEEPIKVDKKAKKCSKTKSNLKNTVAKTKGLNKLHEYTEYSVIIIKFFVFKTRGRLYV